MNLEVVVGLLKVWSDVDSWRERHVPPTSPLETQVLKTEIIVLVL